MLTNSVDAPRSDVDKTVQIFDQFYNFELVVNSNEYELVLSYFKNTANNVNIAQNFTTMLFRISALTGENVLDLVEYLKGTAKNKIQVNALMAYYLNSLKSKTSLYGVGNVPLPNDFVQRNVIL